MPRVSLQRYGNMQRKKKKKRTRTIKQRNIELREDIVIDTKFIASRFHEGFYQWMAWKWRISRECLYRVRSEVHSMWETIKVDFFHFQARSDRWIDRWIIVKYFYGKYFFEIQRFAISFTVLFSGTVPSIGTVHSQFQGSRCTYNVIWPEKWVKDTDKCYLIGPRILQ